MFEQSSNLFARPGNKYKFNSSKEETLTNDVFVSVAKSATNRIATKEAVELTSNVDSILENNRFVGGASCASEEKRCGS